MAVELTDTSANFVGTGISSTYAAPIYANDDDQIGVYVDDVLKTIGDDYVLNGLGSASGISIVATFPLNAEVFVERMTPIKQEVDTQNNETILEDVLDGALDKLTMMIQERAGETARALLVPRGESGLTLPARSDLLGYLLGINLDGEVVPMLAPGGNDPSLRGDLLNPLTGGSIVAFRALGVGAVLTSVMTELRRNITPYQFGAVGDGVADDTAALQRAVTAAITQGKVLDLAYGTYKVTGSISGSGNIRMINSGGATIYAAAGTYSKFGVLVFEGSATQVQNLGANAPKGQFYLTAASATSFAAGDLGTIFNPTGGSWSNYRPYYHAGEFFEVSGVAGATINLRNPLYAGYAAGAVQCWKINPISGYIRDLIIVSDGAPDDLLIIDYARGFRVTNPKLRNKNNTGMMLSRSVDVVIENPDVMNIGDGGDDYGISIAASQHCRVIGGQVYGRRHAVATGGANRTNDVPCRDIVISKAVLKNDVNSGAHCADFHGDAEDCGYDDCTIYGGWSPQGKNNRLTNCRVYYMFIGVCVYAAEVIGGTFTITGNTFYSYFDPSNNSRGIIDFGGNTNAITNNMTEPLTVIVDGNTFIGTGMGPITNLVVIYNRGSAQKINAKVTNNTINVDNFGLLLAVRTDGTGGAAASDFLIAEKNITGLNGKAVLYADGAYSALPVLRLEPQRWKDIITPTTAQSIVMAPAKTFKWVYPRKPVVDATRGQRGYLGNRIGVPLYDALSETGVQLGLATDDGTNFSSSASVELCGNVGIAEV